jgi:membrane-bound lytic murein transglycosylase B
MRRLLRALGALVLAIPTAPALAQSPATPADATPSAAAGASDTAAFATWLDTVRRDALDRGIKPATLDMALTGLAPVARVLERDRQQAEFTLDLTTYLKRRLTPDLIRYARRQVRQHASLTKRVAAAYGVEPTVQIAVWGLESNFGRFSGVRPVVPTLATLAYDDRRRGLFRGELLDALGILDAGDIQLDQLLGSWAGAMGQVQFLPSSYLTWAVDFDKDGRRNIWSSEPDIFASIANYLHGNGWERGVRWGYPVTVPTAAASKIMEVPMRMSGCRAVRDLSEPRPLKEWKRRGVKPARGTTLPASTRMASLLRIDGKAWLVTTNYEAVLAYNCAHTYALSVTTLADRLGR